MESQHVKSINTDARSKKKIKFTSAKERSKKASADVYRSHKRKVGATSATTRERAVHAPQGKDSNKRHRTDHVPVAEDNSRLLVVKVSKAEDEVGIDEDKVKLDISTSLAEELDETNDRNVSEVFGKFYRQVWPLVRSLPEILHHSAKIVDLMLVHMLSPASLPERPSDDLSSYNRANSERRHYIVNHATLDILHLLSVLARDLRHEIHPYLHKHVLPRILQDLLNPPPPPPESGKQPIPLDVTIVETAFRCMSYIFQYDAKMIKDEMELMRKYYGFTLGNRRELIRRLAAESFAPLLRKLKNHNDRHRHLKRVLKALAATETQASSPALKRTQDDAADGIAQLVFQVVRGVPGKLHSQGEPTVEYVLEFCTSTVSKADKRPDRDLLGQFSSLLLEKLCRFVDDTVLKLLTSKLGVIFKKSMTAFLAGDVLFDTPTKVLDLLGQIAQFRDGMAFADSSGGSLSDHWFEALGLLFTKDCLSKLSAQQRLDSLKRTCPLYAVLQSAPSFASSLERSLTSAFSLDQALDVQQIPLIRDMTAILVSDLIPSLDVKASMNVAGTVALAAAARVAVVDPSAALLCLLTMATKHVESDSGETSKHSMLHTMFLVPGTTEYRVSVEDQEALMQACQVNLSASWTLSSVEKLCAALRCIPFVASLTQGDASYEKEKTWIPAAIEWVRTVQKVAESALSSKGKDVEEGDLVLVQSLSLIAMASLFSSLVTYNDFNLEKKIRPTKQLAESFLFTHPSSLWAVTAVASIVEVLALKKLDLSTKADEIFDILSPNLQSPNHALRMHSLRILASLPMKNFVVNHADLDFEGDLDEDPSFVPVPQDQKAKKSFSGRCDIINTMLQLERMPVRLSGERQILSMVSRIEVLGRSGSLPAAYAEAAAHHMLGQFYVKFAPIWPVATKALVGLLEGQEAVVWPVLEGRLVGIMQVPVSFSRSKETLELSAISGYGEHHLACKEWENSEGRDVSVFGKDQDVDDGEVLRHFITNKGTVMESIWEVATHCQRVVAQHSRVIVPCFLDFLSNQYFRYHPEDPNLRELEIERPKDGNSACIEGMNEYDLQHRLLCFLRVFAAIDGPQQMIKHQLLEQTFRAFLIHRDIGVVKVAFGCLLRFKPKYLIPYRDSVVGLLEKGKLRDSLLKLQELFSEGKVATEHRELLIPVLSRILFGKMTTRESRSSKDSPAARRAAVLSCVAVICKSEDELFPFVYFMLRSFMPRNSEAKEVELYSNKEKDFMIGSLSGLNSKDLENLPGGLFEGFLHLLQAVSAQLGHRVRRYIPGFTSIVLTLSRLVAIDRNSHSQEKVDEESEDDEKNNPALRHRVIRTMSCQRLSEIFLQFCDVIDFSAYGEALWMAFGGSLELLPEMAANADKAPALLDLLTNLSSKQSLLPLLEMNAKAISSVIQCISSSSRDSVMHSTLTFVENLLGYDAETANLGFMQTHILLLLERFSARLQRRDNFDETEKLLPTRRVKLRQSTWRRELRILRRVSDLLSVEVIETEKSTTILKELTELLLPYLDPSQGTTDDDKLNVVQLLKKSILSLDLTTCMEVFGSIAGTLGPVKARPGIVTLTVRSEISSLLAVLAKRNPSLNEIAEKVICLAAVNSKRVDEMNFDVVIPALNSLNEELEWKLLGASDPLFLTPIVSTCLHFLHNDDGVIARTALNALKTLMLVASQEAEAKNAWHRLLESQVVPPTRSGLQCRDAAIRRHYILIVRELAKLFRGHDNPNLCGDLSVLLDEENPDLDFFLSITHVQLHRRARAFQRLRKSLATEDVRLKLSSQSLASVLLPLTLHPAYESKTKAEESFALEGIATVGAVARLLPWNKYNNTLGSILASFDRNPEQEKYLVGMMCSILDGFEFAVVEKGDNEDGEYEKTAVWRALENRVIPKVEALLTKEKVDKGGSRVKLIRPSIVLALLKLFQKFPTPFFESKLPRILAVLCDALRNKDSNARDLARNTLSKVVMAMDLKYLSDVIREVTITLNEGFKLHVRAAVVHTILQDLSEVYKPPEPSKLNETPPSAFDSAIAALMDVIQEDLFGVANDRRESKDTNVRFVKEAGGNKSVNSIEILCRMLRFDPSSATTSLSSVHYVVSPLLERLRLPDVDAGTIRRVKEILTRVVIGLANNPSVGATELFKFVYATIHPFIDSQLEASVVDSDDEEEDDDDAIKISGSRAVSIPKRSSAKGKVTEWRPSSLKGADSAKAALAKQKHDRKELRRVLDGASAPKLTGTSRHAVFDVDSVKGINDPATTSAVVFGLNLLHTCLKKMELKDEQQTVAMMDPFVPMLTTCICNCKDNEVTLVAMKCLMSFLRHKLPSVPNYTKSLGRQALAFLSSNGTSLNQNHDMTQACFKTLTYLINVERPNAEAMKGIVAVTDGQGEKVLAGGSKMPLNAEQMKVLIGLLTVSIAESDQHNPALGLIKAILSRRFMSPEFYDLMENMLKLNVRSQKDVLRQQSGGIFIRYLLDYPMGEDRFQQHLKQAVANISYEFQAGRISALQMLTALMERFPEEVLDNNAQLIFLPLVVQLVNENAKECRAAIPKCMSVLLSRSSAEVLNSLHDYTVRWSKSDGPMRAASLQVLAIFMESSSRFLETNGHIELWLSRLEELLQEFTSTVDWETPYFSLVALERMIDESREEIQKRTGLWKCIVERLVDDHPWIKLSSSRIVHRTFAVGGKALLSLLESSPGLLFEVGKNLCLQLSLKEEEQNEELSELAIKTLTLALPIMSERSELCFEKDSPHAGLRDPIAWVLRRLSEVAKPKGRQRRMGIFKCFAAFGSRHPSLVAKHLELLLEPLHRSDLEARNENEENKATSRVDLLGTNHGGDQKEEHVVTEASLARDVLQLLEESCAESPQQFLEAYAAVKSRAREKKEQRKIQAKAEAVQDPVAFAQKKIQKQQREKERKKRRVDERRRDRGGQKKRRYGD
eukprot:Nitzschia sp. Nitz4//scaffold189_size62959//48159//57102//NITZ4_006317-RA/size62959-snap-gene-0.12-mRNA-1//-1//CDS//3329539923//7725//frame0